MFHGVAGLLDPAVFPFVCGLLGLSFGSFLNVVIHRLPRMMENDWRDQCAELQGIPASSEREALTLATPRSRCPRCGHTITPLENIPVASWIFLRGKCSACRAPISMRYPAVEALTALLSVSVALRFGVTWGAVGALVLAYSLIALAFIDFDTQYLPDTITLPLIWAGLLFNLFDTYVPLRSAVAGAMAGYLSLWSVYWIFKLCTGKEGMGHGDFKLLAALGAWFGWQALPAIILLSSLVGAVVGIGLIVVASRGRDIPIPFGPYLASAGLVILFWGNELIRFYLRLG
ncbi:MAG: A24 family peptidase [Candidatus Accumulibacter sp.]|nr:A24 family peptidase [Accumulibacter sp.]